MRINHNIAALNTHRQLNTASTAQSKSMEKLSSGLRINKAGDDAAGLAISEKMRGQIRGLDMASKNAQDGISLIQTAEGALSETHDILQRMRELAVQSGNDTNTDSDRKELQKEVDQLAQEITRISNNTEFNTQNLLNGGMTSAGNGEVKFQIGANANQSLTISINAMDAKTLGVARDTFTATGTSAGDINTVTFDNDNLGSEVVNGAVISAQYTAANSAQPATAGTVIGTAAAEANVTKGGDLELKINGGSSFTVTIADNASKADVVNAINTAANAANSTTGINYASLDGSGVLSIGSNTTGTSSSVSVVDATGTGNTILNDLKISAGTESGSASTAATSAKITLTDAEGNTQDINISDPDATSLSVTSGNFSGLTFNMDATKKLSDLDSVNDTITVTTNVDVATAASFNGGTTAANAKAGIDISTQSTANDAVTAINNAIETVSSERSKLGATQNRLEHTINNLNTSSENLTAAESRIRDVDYALAA
ncbi:flagellin [Solibacillus isronensis]|uniref:flagellin N-terminal helical domain-containing protein n=1 Tax=Solibacillus isronensis TaxID=412383 RepID=UPI002559EB88|nr:flagellin [Solibacillus isronensis]